MANRVFECVFTCSVTVEIPDADLREMADYLGLEEQTQHITSDDEALGIFQQYAEAEMEEVLNEFYDVTSGTHTIKLIAGADA